MMRDYSKLKLVAFFSICFLALSTSFFAGRLSASDGFTVKAQKGAVSEPSEGMSDLDQYFKEDTAAPESTAQSVKADENTININIASQQELDTLPGIGPVMAGRIIDYRTQYGNFQSIDELAAVDGIGEITLNKLREFICI